MVREHVVVLHNHVPLQRSRNTSSVVDVEPLLRGIAAAAVTIGEGPRFPVREVDGAVRSFIAEKVEVGWIDAWMNE